MTSETVTVSTPWYRVDDLPPPLGVRVRVMWDGRVFESARVRHPNTKGECWIVHDRKLGAVFLPLTGNLRRPHDPNSPWSGWHTLKGVAPTYYQPLDPDRWTVPLPAPVEFRSVSQRMYSSTPRHKGVAEDVPGGGILFSQEDLASGQWWRDPLAILYEPRGSVSMKMAEGRVMRAVAACGGEGGWRMRVRTTASVLADLADEIESRMRGEMKLARWHPLPQDVDDFEIAMRWYTQLGTGGKRLSRAQRVVLWRALPVPLSFAEISWEIRRSSETARLVYKKAIEDCWAYANGRRGPADAKLEALKERNRRARL